GSRPKESREGDDEEASIWPVERHVTRGARTAEIAGSSGAPVAADRGPVGASTGRGRRRARAQLRGILRAQSTAHRVTPAALSSRALRSESTSVNIEACRIKK